MDQFGYLVLFAALVLELLALPLPGEVLMTYAGLLIFQGKLSWPLCILMAGAGASAGMTVSYFIGSKLGSPFFEKHGAKIHLGPDKLHKTSQWFERYGNKLLLVAYFIPGVRHFTGYFSGITRLPFRTYMVFAYTGAFIWTGTFISLGKILGPEWEKFHHTITKYLLIAGILAAVILLLYYAYRNYRAQLYNFTISSLRKGVRTFHSLGRVQFLAVMAASVFIALFAIMIGLIQDLLAHEFAEFDDVASFIVQAVFDRDWSVWMTRFTYLASLRLLLPLAAFTLVWVALRGKDRLLEIVFTLVVLFGGELLEEGLRRLFRRVGPGNLPDTFPSEQTLITIIFLGFAAYLLSRQATKPWIRLLAAILVIAASLLVGISRVYFNIQYPSDVVAGYVFGGVWLSLNITVLEIFRITRGKMLQETEAF